MNHIMKSIEVRQSTFLGFSTFPPYLAKGFAGQPLRRAGLSAIIPAMAIPQAILRSHMLEFSKMSVGPWQIILILVIVLIIFGAGKLPKVMGDIAKGVKNFKAGLKEESLDAAPDSGKSLEEKKVETAAEQGGKSEG